MGDVSGGGRRGTATGRRIAALLLVAILGLPAAAGSAQTGPTDLPRGPEDTLAVVPANQTLSNVEVALELSRGTPWVLPRPRVLIARDDAFADALASGALQGEAPLLLVPSAGPVPADVLAEIDRLGAGEAVVLGGPAAVSDAVVGELAGHGLSVRRLAGGSRYETAVEIARAVPPTDTVLLARAFGSADAAPSQAFADALAAGGLAARNGWPVLLTDTAGLTEATRHHLVDAGPARVLIVGGTAAVSQQVADELVGLGLQVERIAGDDRFGTAVEIAKASGADSAADVDRVTVVDGGGDDAWAGGFAAAGHAAQLDAPIVLAGDTGVPPATRSFLSDGIGVSQDDDVVVITCVIAFTTCEEVRRVSGLPESPLFEFSPVPGAPITPGQQITVTVDPVPLAAGGELFVDSECFGRDQLVALDGQAQAVLTVPDQLGVGCDVVVSTQLSNGQFGGVFAFWPAGDGSGADAGAIRLGHFVYSEAGALQQPLIMDSETTCDDDPIVHTGRTHHAQFAASDGGAVASSAVVPRTTCQVQAQLPPETVGVTWQLTSQFAGGAVYASGNGSTARFDLATIPAELQDVLVAFRVELSSTAPSSPGPLPAGAMVRVHVMRADVGLDCDDGSSVDTVGSVDVAAGATCTASTSAGNVVLSQADRPFAFQPTVQFTADPTLGSVLLFRI